MKAHPISPRLWAGILCWALLLLAGSNSRTLAQEISLQSRTEYRWIATKSPDGTVDSSGRLSPFYVLTLRGPVLGGANVYADIGLTGYSGGDPQATVDQRNLRLNLLAQGTRLTLMTTLSRDANRVHFAQPDGVTQRSLVTVDNYAFSGILTYPSYPTVSLQFQRSVVRPDPGEEVAATNRMFGANYEWGPLRFTADDVRQEMAFAETASKTRTYGVNFSQSVLPAVRLTMDHYSTDAESAADGAQSHTTGQVTRARLSALPTPFLVLDADVALLTSTRDDDQGPGPTSRGREASLYLRSEVLPGVLLDLSKRSLQHHASSSSQSSDRTSSTLAAQLHPSTIVLANWTRATSEGEVTSSLGGARALEVSLTSALSPQTDLTASHRRSSQAVGETNQQVVSSMIGIRRQLHPALSVGAEYSQHRQAVARSGERDDSTTHALQLDATWLPDPLWGLRAGLGLARTRDDRSSLSVTPFADIRWEADPATTIVMRYDLRRTQEDLGAGSSIGSVAGATSTGLAGRLTHRLANGGALELVYDYQKGFGGPFVWQKALQLQYTMTY